MSFYVDKVVNEYMKSDKTVGEIFGVNPEGYKNVSIIDLGCSARVNSAVLRHSNGFEVKTLYELLIITLDDLYRIRNFGIGGIKELIEMAKKYVDENKPAETVNNNTVIDVKEIFGENVRNIRTKKKESQTAFARNCGIGVAALRSIEKGTGNPPLSTMASIARYAGCQTSQLFEENFAITNKW